DPEARDKPVVRLVRPDPLARFAARRISALGLFVLAWVRQPIPAKFAEHHHCGVILAGVQQIPHLSETARSAENRSGSKNGVKVETQRVRSNPAEAFSSAIRT